MNSPILRRARPLLGTLVEVSASMPEAITAAFSAVEKVQQLMSYHDPFSDVSRVNHAGRKMPIQVSPWTFEVLSLAQELSLESDGIFDVTVAPRLASWGYLPRNPANSHGERLATWRDLKLRPGNIVEFRRPLHLDLGGIAKGYAVDRAVDAMKAAGAEAGCVNAGGDLRIFGRESQSVQIRHPASPGVCAQTVEVENGAVATSASYFSRKRWRGCAVCPLVDGRTRLPCDDSLSVSVLAPTAVLADALTKIVFARRDASAALLKKYSARALIIDQEGVCSLLEDA